MERDEVTIYEGAFCVPEENLLIRADVLHKRGNSLRLLEVKAKSWDRAEDQLLKKRGGGIYSDWEKYVLDVAFQHYVLERCYPDASIESSLLLADKRAVSSVSGLHQRFLAKRVFDEHTNRNRLTCIDRGRPDAAPMLVEVSAADAVEFVRTKWRDDEGRTFGEVVQDLARICGDGREPAVALGSKCKQCEFRVAPDAVGDAQHSGFAQCWSERFGVAADEVEAQPLGLDLWRNRGVSDQLARGAWRLSDLAAEHAWTGDPPTGTGERHTVQVHIGAGLRPGPYVDAAGLRRRFDGLRYPLHLIDFETSTVAIPFVAGRRPYEVHAFQFSHHVLHQDGRLEHRGEWLEDEVGTFPNYRFLRALRESLGTRGGTFVHYAPHENVVLNQLRRQLLDDPSPPVDRDELVAFVQHWATPSKNEGGWSPSGQRLDLAEWVRETFYDASMRGSYSIKAVLPAVLQSSDVLEQRFGAAVYGVAGGMSSRNFEAKQWFERDADGSVKDPYKLLPPVFEDDAELHAAERIFGQSELREGGTASTAYARLQFEDMGEAERHAIRKALLRYCELDTLAMAMVLLHLRSLAV